MTFLFSNNAQTTLAETLTSTATTLSVASGGGALFPTPSTGKIFAVTIASATNPDEVEICYCTAITSDTMTISRGKDNTTAQSFSAGDLVSLFPTAGVTSLFAQAGYLGAYSASVASDIGGYALNAIVSDGSTARKFWVSTADSNLTVPGADGASWSELLDGYATELWVEDQNYATQDYVESGIVSGLGLAKYQSDPGYTTLPGGAILQYGTSASGSEGGGSVTFPIKFPTACISVNVSENSAGDTWPGSGSGGEPTVHGLSQAPTTNSFNTYSMRWTGSSWVGQTGLGFSWIAVGY